MVIILDIVHRGITLTAKVYFNKQSSNNVRLSNGRTFVNYYFYPNNLSRAGKTKDTHIKRVT